MTSLSGRTNSALLVIDVQNDVARGAYNLDSVVANIKTAVDQARATNVPVIWVQHSDEELVLESPGWEIVPELVPLPNEPRVRKVHRSSFEATELDSILEKLSVGHVYITGMQTNNCVRHTTHSAQERGYDLTILGDAHSTTGYEWNGHRVVAEDVVHEFNDNFGSVELPGRFTRTITTKDLKF